MGQGPGRSRTQANRNGGRNKDMKKRVKDMRNKTQILFLGAGESGKSTIVKQAVLHYGSGFSDNERRQYVRKITNNLIKGASAIFENATNLGYSITDENVRSAGNRLCDLLGDGNESSAIMVDCLTDQIVDDIRILWGNENFQATLRLSHLYHLEDTWVDFVRKLERYPNQWGGPNWLPNDDDMLRARTMTVGYNSTEITLDDRRFVLIDVGGQRSERRKWMNLFGDIDAVIFVTALSEYNQTLFEAKDVNRLQESLGLFKQYSSMNEFRDSAFMLFLNKFDLFQDKFYDKGQELVKPDVPDIRDPPKREEEQDRSCQLALQWFNDIFYSQADRPRNEIYVKVTTALDKKNVKFVLTSCKDHIFTRHLRDAGMMNHSDLNFHQVEE